MQKNIHQTCGKISDLLKLLHLKLKEIQTIDNKLDVLTPKSFKKSMKSVNVKQIKLQKALKKQKVIVQKVMRKIQKKQNKLIKALAVYDKKFAAKNKTQLKDLLTSINLQLKPQMSLPYFKAAYSKFMAKILSIAKGFSPSHFRNFQGTAKNLITKYWKKYLAKARAEWEKKNGTNNKAVKRLNKKAKKSKKGKKNSPIKRIK
jgi:hypothetical protein